MRFPFRFSIRPWVIVPLLAAVYLLWSQIERIRRVEHVTNIAEWSVEEPVVAPNSSTGYAGGWRRLMVPGHHNGSYQWIVQTQQMLAQGDWRVRRVDYDNAPHGRATHAPALYRWWLALVAGLDHMLSGRPFGLAVEHAALWAVPLFHLLLLGSTAWFTARWFGGYTAALVSAGLAALFPFAAEFLPGAPDVHGFAVAAVLGSVLPLLAGVRALQSAARPEPPAARSARRLFFAAGVAGGIGLWVGVAGQIPLLLGISLGGLLVAALDRSGAELPWRSWALGGAVTSLLAYMLEYFPANLGLRFEVNHPLHAIAWLGGGEVLVRLAAGLQRGKAAWNGASVTGASLGCAALATPLVLAWLGTDELWKNLSDPLGARLSILHGVVADNLWAWVVRDGITLPLVATVLPWLLIGVAGLQLRRAAARPLLVLVLVPVLVALAFSFAQLRWCSQLDAALLVLLVAVIAVDGSMSALRRWVWSLALTLGLLPGLIVMWPPARASTRQALSATEVTSLIERDLAHWLARRSAGAAVVLASPDVTTSLYFHGGLRGLGTLDWENKDGLAAAVRIASSTSPDEALALLQQRGVTHIIVPSWDPILHEYSRLGSSMSGNSFMTALDRWVPLTWLRPLPYHLPKIAGFEGQSVTVLEVVDEQEEAIVLSRQAEYFVEMGRLELASGMRRELQRFPGDLGAMVALAQVEAAHGDAAGFARVFTPLVSYLTGGADRSLAWDRRVSLAGVLALGNRPDLAREQVRRCLAEAEPVRLRALTTGSLFKLLALGKKFGLELPDPALREQARNWLPPASRERL